MKQSRQKLARDIARTLFKDGLIQTWYRHKAEGWILRSKSYSPFYINFRVLASKQDSDLMLKKIGKALSLLIEDKVPRATKLVGTYLAGISIATAITTESGIPSCFARHICDESNIQNELKKIQKYGQHNLIEGDLKDKDVLVIIDDLVTDFTTKLLVKKMINTDVRNRRLKITCKDVVVILDREQGAKKRSSKLGMNLHALIPFCKMIEWVKDDLSNIEYEVLRNYSQNVKKYQSREIQQKLRQIAVNKKGDSTLSEVFA